MVKSSKKFIVIIEKWNVHNGRKDASRKENENDNKRAKEDEAFDPKIIDMMAVQNCPKSMAGEIFYLSKISC